MKVYIGKISVISFQNAKDSTKMGRTKASSKAQPFFYFEFWKKIYYGHNEPTL